MQAATLAYLNNEIDAARAKFPEPTGLTAALFEEFGE
jgi:hypothetical protein